MLFITMNSELKSLKSEIILKVGEAEEKMLPTLGSEEGLRDLLQRTCLDIGSAVVQQNDVVTK